MKAPDKIYLAGSNSIKGEVTSNFASSTPFRIHSSIAYIRKDALLEWVKEEMKEWSSESNTAQGVKMGLSLVLDKINAM